jgi:hypothetical protein
MHALITHHTPPRPFTTWLTDLDISNTRFIKKPLRASRSRGHDQAIQPGAGEDDTKHG